MRGGELYMVSILEQGRKVGEEPLDLVTSGNDWLASAITFNALARERVMEDQLTLAAAELVANTPHIVNGAPISIVEDPSSSFSQELSRLEARDLLAS